MSQRIDPDEQSRNMEKAALRGEPSYVWRAGQVRRFEMIVASAGERIHGAILEDGCGVGMYMKQFLRGTADVYGLEFDPERAKDASVISPRVLNGAGEWLPYPANSFDLLLSHEVLEHVVDDRKCAAEMVRVLKPGGRAVVFVPNRGYPFETHGVYWRGKYYFGNKLFVNYLPRVWRDQLAPHVKVYSTREIKGLFEGQACKVVEHRVIFGAYDNIIARFGGLGKLLRAGLQALEGTPLSGLGLSHYLVVEKL
jgi:SAM-dependent methyltransferase